MKRLVTFLVLVAWYSLAPAQWTLIPSGVGGKLDAIHFVDGETGYCSGGFFTLKSTDGGSSWTTTNLQGFRDFDFVDEMHGYGASVVGMSMAFTVDGGNSWTSITPPNSSSLWAVAAVDEEVAFFAGVGGNLWMTLDGGVTAQSVNFAASGTLTDVGFGSTLIGYLVESSGRIYKTQSGGWSWFYSLAAQVQGYWLTEMSVVDAETVYVAGSHGRIFKTTDGGSSWEELNTGSESHLAGIHFIGPDTGIAVGSDGEILYTNTGGWYWHHLVSGTTVDLKDVRLLSGTSAVVVGDSGVILKETNILVKPFQPVGWQEEALNASVAIYPNPSAGALTVKWPIEFSVETVTISDATGRIVYKSENDIADKNRLQLHLELDAGMYWVHVITGEDRLSRALVIAP